MSRSTASWPQCGSEATERSIPPERFFAKGRFVRGQRRRSSSVDLLTLIWKVVGIVVERVSNSKQKALVQHYLILNINSRFVDNTGDICRVSEMHDFIPYIISTSSYSIIRQWIKEKILSFGAMRTAVPYPAPSSPYTSIAFPPQYAIQKSMCSDNAMCQGSP